MKIDNRDYDLNKQAQEITQDDMKSKNQVFSTIFAALDSADGKNDKKLNKTNLINIFKAMVDVDNQSGKGNKILSDNEIKILKEKLLPNLQVLISDFKDFIIELLNANEYKFINVSLGSTKNGVRQVGPNNIAIRESSRHSGLPAKNKQTSGANERIDAFEQGKRGDCYLLAEINAIKNTDGGQKVFKDNITRYNDGSVKITLPGAFKIKQNLAEEHPDKINSIQITGQYKISAQAVERAWRLAGDTYSKGDLDVILYEIAFESYR